MTIRIREKTLLKIENGGTVSIRRSDPRASLWDQLAMIGKVRTEIAHTGWMKITKGSGKPCKPLYQPAQVRARNYLKIWSDIRASARSRDR